MGQLLAGVESLACSGHFWVRSRVVYCVSVYDGGCATMFGVTVDPWSSGGGLSGAGLISILIPADLIKEQMITAVL